MSKSIAIKVELTQAQLEIVHAVLSNAKNPLDQRERNALDEALNRIDNALRSANSKMAKVMPKNKDRSVSKIIGCGCIPGSQPEFCRVGICLSPNPSECPKCGTWCCVNHLSNHACK